MCGIIEGKSHSNKGNVPSGIHNGRIRIDRTLNTGSYDDIYLEKFCRQILDKDYFIRSAKIADHLGHIIASAYTRFDRTDVA